MALGTDQPGRDDIVVSASAREIPPPDEVAHLDGRLMHELTKANYQLSQYVLRYIDADAGRTTPMPVDAEVALASCLETAAGAIRARAERRSQGVASGDNAEGEPR